MTVRLICMSDTHNRHRKIVVPDGDILVHAGDMSGLGRPEEIAAFGRWLAGLPHRHKIVIAGNHDFLFEQEPERARGLLGACHYLFDEGVEVEGLRFWGSPWQPWFHNWAFNLQRGPALHEKWAQIPAGTDVLITHGPPLGHGDRVAAGERVGCAELRAAVRRVRPRLHVFGHIHEGYGVTEKDGTRFANASTCTVDYKATNPPLVIDLEVGGGGAGAGAEVP